MSWKSKIKAFFSGMQRGIDSYTQILHPDWAGTIPYLEKETERHLRKADKLWEKKRKIEEEKGDV